MDQATSQIIQGMIDATVQTASAQMSATTQAQHDRLDSLEGKMGTIDKSSKAADVAFTAHQAYVINADNELRAASDECQLSILSMQNTLKEIKDDIDNLKRASDGNTVAQGSSNTSLNASIEKVEKVVEQLSTRVTNIESSASASGGPTVEDVKMQANRLEHEAVVSAKSVTDIEARVTDHFARMQTDVNNIRTELQNAVQVVQAQVSTAITIGGTGAASGGGNRGRETLDTDKRLLGVKELTGSEPLHEINEWFDKTIVKLESAAPGSRKTLKE